MICFKYASLMRAAKAKQPGYIDAVMTAGRRVGPDVCMSLEAYNRIRKSYATPPVLGPHGRPTPTETPISAVPAEVPSWSTLIANFATESRKWARSGFRMASKGELRRRQKICLPCKQWDSTRWGNTGGCRMCGCTRMKLFWATTSCPLNPPKWVAEA